MFFDGRAKNVELFLVRQRPRRHKAAQYRGVSCVSLTALFLGVGDKCTFHEGGLVNCWVTS
jgi:hypothetical protein